MFTNKQLHTFFSGILVAFSFFFSAEACQKSKAVDSELADTTKQKSVLFIGNSLTYTNDLPAMLAKIGKEQEVTIATKTVAYPNYALEDHWNDGHVQQLIASKKYDFVVVQQGPSSQADGRAMLFDYGARLKTLCDAYNTKLAFFMVWPALSNIHTFDGVIKNYTDAAVETGSLLCPVGKIWKEHFSATNDYSFYGPDMFHPSQKGSENAAMIIYSTIFK
jgi:lysophospholipase L1-like esterase